MLTLNFRSQVAWLAAALTCFGTAGHAQAPGPAADPAKKTRLAFVTNNPSDYWTICRRGTEAAAKDLGTVEVEFVMPADGTAATQKQDVDDLLAKGVQGIAVSPVDPANETPYLNGVAAKTNLITADSDAAASRRLCYVGTDNHAAGVMAGKLIKKALPQGGQIMVFVGKSDAQNAHDRLVGIQDALRGSRVTILGVRTDDTDHARARQNVVDTLAQHPHIAALVGLWSYNGPAIARAVREKGRVGKVRIIAFDEENDTLNGIRDGTIYGTIAQQPYRFGYESVKLLAALVRGDKSGVPAGRRLIIPTLAITQGNLAAYQARHRRQLAGG
jgi:ribose transport system substrate-binding protein